MIKHLIHRPISIFMAFTALFILGIITYMNVPVSLLPDIACSTFYECNGITITLLICLRGLWCNSEIQVCDYPMNIEPGTCTPPMDGGELPEQVVECGKEEGQCWDVDYVSPLMHVYCCRTDDPLNSCYFS